MSSMVTIAKREFRSYFESPLAYVVICLSFLALGLVFFMLQNFFQLDRATVAGIFEWAPLGLSLLVIPVVTMRLIAEEKRSGTLEMLITLPVKDSDVVLGKYFGALGLVLVVALTTLAYPIAMFKWPWNLGPLDWGPVWAGYLGIVLFSAAAVALGMLISSLTDSQAIAFFLTFFLLVGLWLMANVASAMPSGLGTVLRYLSFRTHLEGFTRGLIDTRDIVYFLSVTVLALTVSFRVLERRKWA